MERYQLTIMKNDTKKGLFYFLFLTTASVSAQTVNYGGLFVMPNTEVSTMADLENKENAMILNDGTLYVYKDFTNNGLFDYTTNKKTGYTVFRGLDAYKQELGGSKPSKFFDVLFDNPTSDFAFDLQADITVAGTANFTKGVVNMDHQEASIAFLSEAKAINASNGSFVSGLVEKQGKDAFAFPIGKNGLYRHAALGISKELQNAFYGEYFLENSNALHSHNNRTGVIEWINDAEYWVVESEKANGHAILSLSWNENTTPAKLLNGDRTAIHIVRWDEKQQLWVDEGGFPDEGDKTITTPVAVEGYGIFTLGLVKKSILLEGDVVVYNAVSPDGDGHNDYLIIDNIQRFPVNRLEVYNRWGVKVYETTNYDSNGNVFKGYSEGRGTVKKGEKLPSGTYYYVLKYDYSDDNGSKTITKSGYLHLEND